MNAGHRFFKNLKTLLVQFGRIERHAGQIATRGTKAGHQAAPDRIARRSENDRDCPRCTLGLDCRGYADNYNHIRREFDDLGRDGIERLTLFVRKAVLDCYILAFDVAQIAKAPIEGVDKMLGPSRCKIGD